MSRRNYGKNVLELQRWDCYSYPPKEANALNLTTFSGEKWRWAVRKGYPYRHPYAYGPDFSGRYNNPGGNLTYEWNSQQGTPVSTAGRNETYNIECSYDVYASSTFPYTRRSPKWGWRSAHTDCEMRHYTSNTTGIWNIDGSEKEIEFWVRPGLTSYFEGNEREDDNAGRIFAFLKNAGKNDSGGDAWWECSRTAEGKMTVTDSSGTFSPSGLLPKGEWAHLRFQFYGKNLTVWINGVNCGTQEMAGSYAPAEVRWGPGMDGEIDEIVLRNKLTPSSECTTVPTHPYLAQTDIKALGGWGDRKLGSVSITQSCRINSYAPVVSADGRKVTVSGWTSGVFGEPEVGDEVMIRVGNKRLPETYKEQLNVNVWGLFADYTEAGKFAFRKITGIQGSVVELDSPVTEEFDFEELASTAFVQLITVPNFASLAVGSNAVITPAKLYETEEKFAGGGIVAFRTRGDCTVDGKIITLGYGCPRYDQMLYGFDILPDQFLMCGGGGVFAMCGGKFTASRNARIGAEWDGAKGMAEGGIVEGKAEDGGAGWGGASGGLTYKGLTLHGLKSASRHGGGGDNSYNWLHEENNLHSIPGEYSPVYTCFRDDVYRTGVNPGGAMPGYDQLPQWANCTSYYQYDTRPFHEDAAVYGGASVLIACHTLNADKSAVSTGGQGGFMKETKEKYDAWVTYGGGGSGLCYITAKEMI